MKLLSFLVGILGLGVAAYLNFSPAFSLANVGQEQIARINQDLAFDLSYCETGVIGQTEAACKTEARADHARRIDGVRGISSTILTVIVLGIGGVSLLSLLYAIFGKSGKKNIPQPAYGAYSPYPQQPTQASYQQPQQPPSNHPLYQQPPQQEKKAPVTLESKLAELNALKQSGAITEDEYKSMRQNLLNTF